GRAADALPAGRRRRRRVARGRAARRPAGGGERIQAPRRSRARLTASAAALACAAAVATYPAVSAGRVSWLPPSIGAAGVALVAVGLLVRRPFLVTWSVAGLGAEDATWPA